MKCLADITVRSIPHEFYRCELEAGHSGAHQDGRTIWTGPDTHYDFEPKAMLYASRNEHSATEEEA